MDNAPAWVIFGVCGLVWTATATAVGLGLKALTPEPVKHSYPSDTDSTVYKF